MELYKQVIDALDLLYKKKTTPGKVKIMIDDLIDEVIRKRMFLSPAEEERFNKMLDEVREEGFFISGDNDILDGQLSVDDLEGF